MDYNPPVDILILTYNRKFYLENMIDSIVKYTVYPYRLIIADNGSEIETLEYIESLKQKKIITGLALNRTNLFMDGWSSGVSMIKSGLFALSDPDIIVPNMNPCWLTRLVNCFNLYPDIVRLGISLSDKNIPPCWNKFESKFLTLKTGKIFSKQPLLRLSTPDTTMQLIKTSVFAKAGGFETKTIDFEFLKKLGNYGICAVHQEICGYHQGWNEYKDYPEYLRQKDKNIRHYRETKLIK